MKKYKNVTYPNLISKLYFNFLYYFIYQFCNKKDKILDFGGGIGLLKSYMLKRGIKNIIIYDKIKKLSETKDWTKLEFDTVIISQVLYLLSEQEIRNLFRKINKKKINKIIIAFSTQSLINKVFAFFLFHKDAHKNTKTSSSLEEILIEEYFFINKKINFFGLFKVIKSTGFKL
ncbi:hypothetical protein OAR82_03685 [Candidatus Pelagibacter sp.]|nr:hypothetical protein [Candidatus Pelagibacter sp.]